MSIRSLRGLRRSGTGRSIGFAFGAKIFNNPKIKLVIIFISLFRAILSRNFIILPSNYYTPDGGVMILFSAPNCIT